MTRNYREWVRFRTQWLKDNPPNHQGYYVCGICGSWVHRREVVLDHIKPQGFGHRGKFDPDNIQPAHQLCNGLKGSRRDYDAFRIRVDK